MRTLSLLSHTHTHTLKSINKRQKKGADLGQQTCLHAVERSSLSAEPPRGGKGVLTLPVTKPQKPLTSTASICLVTGCTLLLRYLSYYCSMHYITAVSALLPPCPPRYGSTGFGVCKCHHFYCRQHPYYLSIILVNAAQALMPHC